MRDVQNKKVPETVLITGASRGLGKALAIEYAASGRVLAIAARGAHQLKEVERECRRSGARVVANNLDMRNHDMMENWIRAVDHSNPVDLLIANAGIFSGIGKDGKMEPSSLVTNQIDTNLIGTIATINCVAAQMMKRRSGHIAIITSLSAIRPMADAPTYSATKAGLLAYGEAIRENLASYNISVSLILPGHIETEQTAIHSGKLPAIISAQKAAKIIRKSLDRKKTLIAFPTTLYWLVRLERILPWYLRSLINRPFRFYVNNVDSNH